MKTKVKSMGMKKLDPQNMEVIVGGSCSRAGNQAIAVIGLVTGVCSFIPVIGWAMFGPAAVGMGIASVVCAYS